MIFTIQLRDGAAAENIEAWLGDPQGGEQIGIVTVENKSVSEGCWRESTIPVHNLSGRHAVYLKFTSENPDATIADLRSFVFTRDTP